MTKAPHDEDTSDTIYFVQIAWLMIASQWIRAAFPRIIPSERVRFATTDWLISLSDIE